MSLLNTMIVQIPEGHVCPICPESSDYSNGWTVTDIKSTVWDEDKSEDVLVQGLVKGAKSIQGKIVHPTATLTGLTVDSMINYILSDEAVANVAGVFEDLPTPGYPYTETTSEELKEGNDVRVAILKTDATAEAGFQILGIVSLGIIPA